MSWASFVTSSNYLSTCTGICVFSKHVFLYLVEAFEMRHFVRLTTPAMSRHFRPLVVQFHKADRSQARYHTHYTARARSCLVIHTVARLRADSDTASSCTLHFPPVIGLTYLPSPCLFRILLTFKSQLNLPGKSI